MDEPKRFPAWIGIACTWVGAAVGIFAVTAMAAGLKATFTPDMRTAEVFRGILGPASIIAFGVAAALMITGALLGRRRKTQLAIERELMLRGENRGASIDFSREQESVRDRIHPGDMTE